MTPAEYKTLNEKYKKKRPKYRNTKTVLDGVKFDSLKEARRWQQLAIMQSHGIIKGLQRQVAFPLVVNGNKIAKYIADFQYELNGERIIEDVKGFRTREFIMKSKLMKACLGIEVLET